MKKLVEIPTDTLLSLGSLEELLVAELELVADWVGRTVAVLV